MVVLYWTPIKYEGVSVVLRVTGGIGSRELISGQLKKISIGWRAVRPSVDIDNSWTGKWWVF
jgi:hypothetical protein